MTNHAFQADMSTLDARRDASEVELSDDGMSYRFARTFGAQPERIFRAFTDPADLRVWFPSGAPDGSELTRCDSDPVDGGRYHYEMVIPEYGQMVWHGRYTSIDRPGRIEASEWFVMGDADPTGSPSTQTLTFEAAGDGMTFMTMLVNMPEPEDPETFMEQSAAGLSSSLSALDELVSA